MKESQVSEYIKGVSQKINNKSRLFRNNVGLFYNKIGIPTRCGLHTGSADFIGWYPVKVTPEMVGKTVALFYSVETKRKKGGRSGEEQLNWKKNVCESGGISVIVNNPDKLEQEVEECLKNLK